MTERNLSGAHGVRRMFLTALLASCAIPTYAAAATGSTAVDEVIVTATKRSESLQSVPISVQALTPKVLGQHQVLSFDDYAKLLPSVSFQSFGPGQSQPYFRGITSGGDGLHSGSVPGTGVYLDETPVTTIGNGIDLHLYDVSRVEALSGPQGTLYGASSLSGTLRIITNKPDPNKFSAAFDVQGDKFGPGGFGGVVEGYVNVPITDKIAIRLVGFDEHDGGYIDNVFKDRAFTIIQTSGPNAGDPLTLNTPDGLKHTNNAAYLKKDFNTVDTFGGRAALKVDLNDSWSVTPSVAFQNQIAKGNFLYNPKSGDLKTSDFSPEYNKDKWYQAALTIQGKLGNWDILYSGGYFGRRVDNASDYSYYAIAYDGTSYDTFPTASFVPPNDTNPDHYLNPNQHFTGRDDYTKENHELRLTSPSQYRLKAVGGVFYERQTDKIIANYIVPGLAATGDPRSIPGAGDDIYFTNLLRIDRDFAVFGEASYDLLPNLTASVGGRYFTVDNTLDGLSGFVGSTFFHRGTTEYGETHKVNVSWKIDPQRMVYVTYSTGFRPGGINRRDEIAGIKIGPYAPDTITNYEIGWKTSWLDGRLRVNGALFDEEWHDVQYAIAPPGGQGITATFNVGYARSRGVEGDINYRLGEHWTLSGSGTVLEAQLTKAFCSYLAGISPPTCDPNQTAPAGIELPIQPRYKFNATARYEFNVWDYRNFLQASVQTQGDTRSALFTGDENALGPTKGFTTFDLSGGVAKGNWTIEAFAQNVFDRRGTLSINVDCSITYCGPYPLKYPTKPQFFGIKFGAKY